MQAQPRDTRAQRTRPKAAALAVALALPLFAACASTGGGTPDADELGAARASILQYPGADFILVNQTYADRMAGSTLEAGTKVSPDEVLLGVSQLFDELDFWDYARPGTPPDTGETRPEDGGMPVPLAIVYTDATRSGWLPMRAGQNGEELAVAAELVSNFTALWNRIEDYHGVYNTRGDRVFQQPTYNR